MYRLVYEKPRVSIPMFAQPAHEGAANGLTVRLSKAKRFLPYRDIVYVEVIDHYVYFHMRDGSELELYGTFKELALVLTEVPCFAQCHRSYIVNMGEITVLGTRELTLRDGVRIPISRGYPNMKERYAGWLQ